MSLNKFILCLVLVFVSCKHAETITFLDNTPREVHQYIQQHQYTVIIYIDIATCTPCSLSNLAPWKNYKKTLDKYDTGVVLVFRNPDEEKIIDILKSMEITFHFMFDKNGKFKAENKIFKSITDNIFVINKNKNVIFSESPIKNEQKWEKFFKIMTH
jgi:arsenate reductase-like glutaredoxin family protein